MKKRTQNHELPLDLPGNFRAWVESLPPEHWARYDLSACRLGWEAALKQTVAQSGDETYYTKNKDADFFESLGDEEFAWEITKAHQDIADGDFDSIESYMPIVAMLASATDRIKHTAPIDLEVAFSGAMQPCPACQAQNVFLTHSVRNRDARKHVECRICSMQGPVKTSNEEASRAWNELPRERS